MSITVAQDQNTSLTDKGTDQGLLRFSMPSANNLRAMGAALFSLVSVNLSEAAVMATYPFAKADFDGGVRSSAINNNTGTTIAARALSWTGEVQSSLVSAQSYQFDFVTTLTQVVGQTTTHANNIKSSTATIYLASSLTNFNAGNYIGTLGLNVSDFVDADRAPLTTYNVANGGTQFTATRDLGNNLFGSANLSMSTYTNPQQTEQLRSMFQLLPLNSTAIIGISFTSSASDGFMSLTGTTTDLGNDALFSGTIAPTISLGFSVQSINIPEPSVVILGSLALTLFALRRQREE